jgi:hypothetical protein
MTAVKFPTAIGGSGRTYSDDNDPNTGMADGGHLERWMPLMQDVVAAAAYVGTEAPAVHSSNEAAQAAAFSAQQAKSNAELSAETAEYWAGVSAAFQSDAVTLNPRIITSNLTIPSTHNAHSVGPIKIAPDVFVTVANGAVWQIT